MKSLFIYSLLIIAISSYSRIDAVNYAKENYTNIQHKCGVNDDHIKCTPFAYLGKEHCNYESHGGDCANFVSQCLVFGGGHENLKGTQHCRGYPCGFEEPGARNLGYCLIEKGWNSTCGQNLEPPSYIQIGDVLIYHENGCDLNPAHAVIITQVDPDVRITGRSEEMKDEIYSYNTDKPYYQWLHYNEPVDDYGKTYDSYEYVFTVEEIKSYSIPCDGSFGQYTFYIYGKFNKDVDISNEINIDLITSTNEKIIATCTPFDAYASFGFFMCIIDICVYPLNNVDIYFPKKAPKSNKIGFKDWGKIISSNEGTTLKFSKVTCVPKEINTFFPTSIKVEEDCSQNENAFLIYGKWDDDSKEPFFLNFHLLIKNEKNDIANCEYMGISPIHMYCTFNGKGIITFEDIFVKEIKVYKIQGFTSSVEIKDLECSSYFMNLGIILLIILLIL